MQILQNKNEIILLTILCVIDIITGVINACKEKQLSSKIFKKGIIGKLYEFVIILIASIIDYLLDYDCMTAITIIFYISYEIMSILENTSQFVPYPQSLKDLLEKYEKGGQKEDGDDGK